MDSPTTGGVVATAEMTGDPPAGVRSGEELGEEWGEEVEAGEESGDEELYPLEDVGDNWGVVRPEPCE